MLSFRMEEVIILGKQTHILYLGLTSICEVIILECLPIIYAIFCICNCYFAAILLFLFPMVCYLLLNSAYFIYHKSVFLAYLLNHFIQFTILLLFLNNIFFQFTQIILFLLQPLFHFNYVLIN